MNEGKYMRSVLAVTVMLLSCCFFTTAAAEESTGKRFQQLGEHIVLDTKTGLMWAAQDNGQDIDWYDAQAYCDEFSAGGYSDWRMPDIKELATLYDPEHKNLDGYFLTDAIRITNCCIWSSYETMGGSYAFSFASGKRPAASLGETYQLRALPVRSAGPKDSAGYDVVNRHVGMNP